MSQPQISLEEFARIVKQSRTHPERFVTEVLGTKPWKTQVEIIRSVFENKITAVKTCNSVGKALAIDTPLLTTRGWITMADVRVGDKVFSPNGSPVEVTHVHPVRERETYKVSFDNKTSIVVDGDHLWTTLPLAQRHKFKSRKAWHKKTLSDWRDYWHEGEALTTRDMAGHVKARGINNYLVPTTKPLELPKRKYELDPYVLGAWLGDGHTGAACITKPDEWLREHIRSLGYFITPMKDNRSFRFWPKGDGITMLKRVGVYDNKSIPFEYMMGSYKQRLDLLRGLMDTDGYCDKKRGIVELCFTNQRLSEDAASLIASLGWKVAVTESDAKIYGRFISRRWRIHFRADVCPFNMPRKAALWHAPAGHASKSTGHLITAIEKVETVPTRCITVANDDGLFLVGRALIPTHNSFIAARIVIAYLLLYKNSIVVTTAPTWSQLTDVLWANIADAVNSSLYPLTNKEINQAKLKITEKWYAVARSPKRKENLFGYHADNILVVVDEAGGVDEPIFEGVAAITQNLNAHVLLTGNPTKPSGTFFNYFDKPELGAQCFTISAFDSPNLKMTDIHNLEDLLALYTPQNGIPQVEWTNRINKQLETKLNPNLKGLIDPATVYRRYHEWGTDHSSWQALIMGEFPTEGNQQLIATDLVTAAMNMRGTDDHYFDPETEQVVSRRHVDINGWNIPDGPPEYGVDMARYGDDSTVVTPRHGGWVDDQIVWNKTDLMTSADKILNIINPLDSSVRVNIDDSGNGGGTTDRLRQISYQVRSSGNPSHQYQLAAYNFGSKEFMQEPDKFHDITSELYWNLRVLFQNHAISIPNDIQLRDELIARRWEVLPNSKIKVESKMEYKKRTGGKSPDRSDSLALTFSGGNRNSYVPFAHDSRDAMERAKPVARPITAGINPYAGSGARQF